MPFARVTPITNEIYHVYNRGVEKRNIFRERVDYIRFIHDLFEFNDTNPAPEFSRRYTPKDSNVGFRKSHIKPGEKIVEILSFCLMDNHYHLLLRQIKDGGISSFMRKLGIGYVNAFNAKNERVGPLFQGRYKLKHVDREEYLRHLVCYIHLNPLKFLRKFNESRKMDLKRTWDALNSYRWSSHLDCLGEDNFGSVIEKKFILELFDGPAGYKEFVRDWMRYEAEKLEVISPLAIDSE